MHFALGRSYSGSYSGFYSGAELLRIEVSCGHFAVGIGEVLHGPFERRMGPSARD